MQRPAKSSAFSLSSLIILALIAHPKLHHMVHQLIPNPE